MDDADQNNAKSTGTLENDQHNKSNKKTSKRQQQIGIGKATVTLTVLNIFYLPIF